MRYFSQLVALILMTAATGSASSLQEALPTALEEVGFDQRLGDWVPLDLRFRDDSGDTVELGHFFSQRPVLLVPVYFECPMLCPMVLNGLTSALAALPFDPGREFEVLVVSFDHREATESARRTKATTLQRYARPGSEAGWHFLTGDESAIRALTDSVGFRFAFQPETGQFAHAAGIVALTPAGQIARYFYGVEHAPKDLRLGLVEAADGKIGSVVDQLLLYCYHYDPETGSYSAVAMNIVRLGASVFVALFGLFLWIQWRRDRRRRSTAAEAA